MTHVRRDAGFSILEAIVAVTILAVGVGSLASLVVVATNAVHRSRTSTLAVLLAQEKVEQLRALAWGLDSAGLPISDTTSDTRLYPEAASGGTGLGASPGNALSANVDGYFDFADSAGRLLEDEDAAAFIRRWSITSVSAGTVLIRVHVLGGLPGSRGVLASLASVRTRRGFR